LSAAGSGGVVGVAATRTPDWKTTPALGAAGRAAMRVLVWIALWAEALRTVATVAGVWSAGSWGIFATLFVGVLAPAWMFALSPTWIAWRLLSPVDLPRNRKRRGPENEDGRGPGPPRLPSSGVRATLGRARAHHAWIRAREALVLAGCWLSPLCRARDLRGIRTFLRARHGRPFPLARHTPADPWTVLAAAVQAERQGNLALVEQIVDALACLPAGARFPWFARVHGGEALVLGAVRRRDYRAALRFATIGRGRLVRLLVSVAEGQTGVRLPRRRLWLRWALAPGRWRTFPLVREAAARLRTPARATPPPGPSAPDLDRLAFDPVDDADLPGVDPRVAHVILLGQVARGRVPAVSQVMGLAAAWSRVLEPAVLARVGACALELDVRQPRPALDGLRARVLDELGALVARAEGELPPLEALTDPLARALGERARDQLAAAVDGALRRLTARDDAGRVPPLEAWTRWLALRAVVEEVERRAGRTMLTILWHGTIRNAAWRWASSLFNQDPTPTAWMAHMVFAWLADHAERVGDLGGQLTNRENARAALATDGRNPW